MFNISLEFVLADADRQLFIDLKETLMAFSDSIAKLDTDVKALIAQGSGAVAAAVAAKDASDASAVDAVDATVVAALAPPAAPAA